MDNIQFRTNMCLVFGTCGSEKFGGNETVWLEVWALIVGDSGELKEHDHLILWVNPAIGL